MFYHEPIEEVDEYKYPGLFLGPSGSFVLAKKNVAELANKTTFALMKERNLELPIDIQIDFFNKTLKRILLYGCDLLSVGYIDMIKIKVILKFYKQVLNLKKSTPSNMIYGELGILPLYIDI